MSDMPASFSALICEEVNLFGDRIAASCRCEMSLTEGDSEVLLQGLVQAKVQFRAMHANETIGEVADAIQPLSNCRWALIADKPGSDSCTIKDYGAPTLLPTA